MQTFIYFIVYLFNIPTDGHMVTLKLCIHEQAT